VIDERLLGRWENIPGPGEERATAEFTRDGSLTYTFHTPDAEQIILLRFSTRDGVIISDQPSEPREEHTGYRFERPDLLVMTYDGEDTRFRRA
jgi:hypothetical protein